jgi:hypothetical protein
MATKDSRRAALDITEILENVLSFLPPRTLFGVQRVSHLWKSTIAASPPIQEKMFLRIRTKTPEIWMQTNPRTPPYDWYGETKGAGLDRKFRIVGDIEMRAMKPGRVDWLHQLFTPVTLNPFLHSMQDDFVDERIEDEDHAFWATLVPTAKFAQHNSFRDTYLTDPPCKEVSLYMNYEARSSPDMLPAVTGYVEIRSNKPLTLGDIIDQTLASRDTWLEMQPSPGTSPCLGYRNFAESEGITLAQHIKKLEKQHNCSFVLKDQESDGLLVRLSLYDTSVRLLLLTDAEYLRFKPTEQ